MPTKRTIGSDALAAMGCAVIGLPPRDALRGTGASRSEGPLGASCLPPEGEQFALGNGPSRSYEAPFLHHRPRVVERFREASHQLVDLGFADDERRAERDDVARHVAQYRAVVLGATHEERADARLRVERLLRRFVANELDSADQA